jgi:ribosome biogenesis GTPase / thiamine phosphate phosphatase
MSVPAPTKPEPVKLPEDWKEALGWNSTLAQAFEPFLEKGLEPARVALVYRKSLRVICSRGEIWARTGGRIIFKAASVGDWPAVGDWVAVRIPSEGEGLVQAVLPRKSAFIRKVAGENDAPQVLATNLDTVLVVMGLDRDFNIRRLERFLTLGFESGAEPVVVLNKKDVAPSLEEQLREVAAVCGGATVLAVSAINTEGLEPLRNYLSYGKTVVLLGSSGVGKSTLVNRLLGTNFLPTGDTRDDGRGRHTTTERSLISLPGGGAIVDTPGLREVQMWNSADGLAKTFDDVDALARSCRFQDCRHQAEPGCAVKQAVESGALDEFRFASWLELQKEIGRLATHESQRGRTESKRRERVGHQSKKK